MAIDVQTVAPQRLRGCIFFVNKTQETWEPCEGKGFKSKDLRLFSCFSFKLRLPAFCPNAIRTRTIPE